MYRAALLLATAITFAGHGIAETVQPQDIRVIDGDTIEVDGLSYRLMGFDTPETYFAKCDYEKALGDAATRYLSAMITSGKLVELRINPGRDKYGRGLGYLYIGGHDVGPILIGEGLARAYEGGRRERWCE